MFEHLLVPIRIGRVDGGVLEAALGLARLSQADATLVHVVEKVPGLPAAEMRAFHQQLSEAAGRELQEAAKTFSRAGIPVEWSVVVGDDAAIEIVRLAAKRGSDLIVIGSHTVATDRTGRGFGTTSYKVGLMCQCPVFLIKESPPKPKKAKAKVRGPRRPRAG